MDYNGKESIKRLDIILSCLSQAEKVAIFSSAGYTVSEKGISALRQWRIRPGGMPLKAASKIAHALKISPDFFTGNRISDDHLRIAIQKSKSIQTGIVQAVDVIPSFQSDSSSPPSSIIRGKEDNIVSMPAAQDDRFGAPSRRNLSQFSVPFICPDLTGRESDLDRLNRSLRDDNVAITGSAALTGQGGIGKTQLAVAYAYRHANEYDGVFWLPGNDADSLIQTMAGYAVDLELGAVSGEGDATQVQARQFFGWLRRNANILLIVDDIQDARFLVQDIPGLAQCRLATLPCRLLTTTRLMQPAGVTPVPLELLSEDDALAMLVHESGVEPSPDARIAVLLLGRLPLAIKLAAGYLRFTKATLEGLIGVLRQAGISELESKTADGFRPFDYGRPVKALLEESWRTLDGRHGRYARRLLQILALLPVNRIHSGHMLKELLPIDRFSGDAEALFNGSISIANERNLLEVAGEGGLRLHPIIHDLLQTRIPSRLGLHVARRAAHQFRETDYLLTLDPGGFLGLAQDIPMLLPLGDAETESRLSSLSRLIDLQFHAIQLGADPLAQLQFQAAKMGDQEFATIWAAKLHSDGASRLLLRWTTAQPTPALMRVLVSMSSGIFGFGFDAQSDLVSALVNGGEDRDFPALRLWRTAGNDPDNPFLDKEEPFQVSAMAASGKSVITVDTTGLAKLWDVATGVERACVRLFDEDKVSGMELWGGASVRSDHLGNRSLVLGRSMAWLVDFKHKTVEKAWSSRTDSPYSLYGDISADGALVIFFDGQDLTLQQAGRKGWRKLPAPAGLQELRLSRDGKRFVTRIQDRLARFALQSPQAEESGADIAHFGPPFCFSVNATADQALVGYTNGVLGWFDLGSGMPKRFILDPGGHVMACAMASDSRFGLAETTDNSLRLWDLEKGEDASAFKGKPAANMMCSFRRSEAGEQVVTLDLDGHAHFWDAQTGAELPEMSVQVSDKDALAGSITGDGAWVCAIGQRGRLQAFGVDQGIHREWELPKPETGFGDDPHFGEMLDHFQQDDDEEPALDETDIYIVSCQTPWVAVLTGPREVFVAHLESATRFYTLRFKEDIYDLDISPCGRFLGVLMSGGLIDVMGLGGKGKPKRKQRLQTSQIMAQKICVGPDGEGVALGHLDHGASILASDESIQNSFDTVAETIPLEFSVDGERLLMIEGDDRLVIAPTRETGPDALDLFVGNVRYAKLNRDGNRLAVLGHDGSIFIFDCR
ncbi:hypothetical protein MAIT1_04545 [Magnetofaba australis IT-1]|uniref:NB-ARC domain-containing protein n=2 Tax=Magnetofaba TaxID=1472292 RepID=A0A1Y2KCE4_9PROT|nr:hypothetical protein MAIT1_04545 [Magnetofaba australis IT-1]